MNRQAVQSSNLASVGYDSHAAILEIEFNSGSVYQYYGVPTAIHEGLMSADSHGRFFHAYIRDVYQYQRVS
jgi:hypothetical protein